jgi:kynurenine 3-monooxygenase
LSFVSTGDLTEAVLKFSKQRAPDIETLVRVSHNLDRPGAAGIFTFLIPIIMDGIFSKVLPQLFTPNVITMLQSEELTFQEVALRKRLDRIGQLAILGGGLATTVAGTKVVFDLIFSS